MLSQQNKKSISRVKNSLLRLTKPKRLSECSLSQKLEFLLPVRISSNKTPKLKTSDFVENCPSNAYSGDMYPLKQRYASINEYISKQTMLRDSS